MSPSGTRSWFLVVGEGDCVRIRTSHALVARRRLHVRIASALCIVGGLALVFLSPWTFVLAALGVIGFAVAPRLFDTTELLEIDRARDRITPLQSVLGSNHSVPASQLEKVSGIYEVYGWDPRSTVYAELGGGQRVPILVFVGTHEELAEEACRLLGTILGVEATYAGPYGAPRVCFTPAEPRDSGRV